jgi:hypothetical protein
LTGACGYLATSYRARIIAGRRWWPRAIGRAWARLARVASGRCKRRGATTLHVSVCTYIHIQADGHGLAGRAAFGLVTAQSPGVLAGWLQERAEAKLGTLLLWRESEREREEPCHRPHLTCLPAPAYIDYHCCCLHHLTTTVTPPPSPPSPPPPPSLDSSLLPSVPSAETERPATTRARATSQGLNHRPRGPPLLLLLLLLLLLSSLLLTSPLHHPHPHHRANWTRRCLASRLFATAGISQHFS